MARPILQALIRLLFRLFSRLDVQGWENIPASGAALVASNHLGLLDAPLVFALLQREDSTSLVTDKYKSTLLRPLVEAVHGIWINREQADLHALREALQYLQKGGLLGIAPEGTRSQTGGLIEAKTGVAYLADKAACPVIPMAIWGTEGAVRQLFHFHRPAIHVWVGSPVCLPPVPHASRVSALQGNTDEIMCRIAAMLPPQYRGVYIAHPRLLKILAGQA